MRLNYTRRQAEKTVSRKKNKVRIRKKVFGTGKRPRLCVFKSAKFIYGQIVDDDKGQTLVSSSSLKSGKSLTKESAKKVGLDLAKKAKDKKITGVVFDRGGYVYHGRVRSLAEGAREGGLKF